MGGVDIHWRVIRILSGWLCELDGLKNDKERVPRGIVLCKRQTKDDSK